MPHQQEQPQTHSEVSHELRMAARHAIPLAIHHARPLLPDQALEREVEGFAGHLPGEHEEDLDFAGGVEEGHVDDAEGLRDQGQPGAEVGERVRGVVVDVREGEGGEGGDFHCFGVCSSCFAADFVWRISDCGR